MRYRQTSGGYPASYILQTAFAQPNLFGPNLTVPPERRLQPAALPKPPLQNLAALRPTLRVLDCGSPLPLCVGQFAAGEAKARLNFQ